MQAIAIQTRICRPRRLCWIVGGRYWVNCSCPSTFRLDQFHDLPCERKPRDPVGTGQMGYSSKMGPPARRMNRLSDSDNRLCDVCCICWAADLIVDHSQTIAFGAKPQHGSNKVAAEWRINPRSTEDNIAFISVGDRNFASQFRSAVNALRRHRIRLDVRTALFPVKYVVG